MTLQVTRTPILTGRDNSLAIALCRNEQPSALWALPAELLLLVATCMPASSFSALRLTCRDMAAKTSHAYEEYILQTRWRISEDSLATLLQVSRSPRFRQKLKQLRISINFLHSFFSKDETDRGKPLWTSLVQQQTAFLGGDRPTALLTLILSNLPNLQEIEIGQWCKHREKSDLGWGGKNLERLTGQHLSDYGYHGYLDDDTATIRQYASPITVCFKKMLMAIAVAQPQLVRLTVYDWDKIMQHGIQVDRLDCLEHDSPMVLGLAGSFTGLTSFRLLLDYSVRELIPNWNRKRSEWLTTMINVMPNLRTLFLGFDGFHDDDPEEYHLFDSHLDATSNMLQRGHLRMLASLELSNADLVLRRVRFSDDGNDSVDSMTWQQLFGILHMRRTLDLQQIHLTKLYDRRGGAIIFSTGWLVGCKTCRREPDESNKVFDAKNRLHHTYTSDLGVLPVMPTEDEIQSARAIQEHNAIHSKRARKGQREPEYESSDDSDPEVIWERYVESQQGNAAMWQALAEAQQRG
ncbi:hypothetical protein LTR56_006662 [Elasticomyces elasticus]|nr:hypothetical protein LTR22_012827 [Elasticomyces elasticus]KAK3649763.1 hypothetical protein LTR56_006662 [Elasticomyces elasticus]KAK4918098.1 hypothetical protein LTR49_014102 [Elasticomyces elasticus]KAK5757403.1 hypothetical protein LTS12_012486 [Elasticomyces elasticus]